ncbi:MAG TPA: phytanoyl-CoA dioxygenase family protein [Cyclobacteriaceae bacterium]|jgi:ectoine hydroxylase-related dioxygenase (phytanoyl-CoA dioxygenase family)|nr:phytanoyl-CoA dioxygenase family protein [Cytophagales bacterium]HMR57774.1 phytanoyl-CoA dioxygenase family protein [Cyclobacteriaceae bacterium]HNT49781.1 phytanoyl-CoA dioxygenase family protein [Cyclobacteriaceae bacterium]HRE66583.1 phytanoyl-CoA dioxygenase family protein [Cyclobacteriaceae bacterium]HRF31883.1 phytanoyl-CoA dioxygenase family protein [Cyclobacteriaceae bacterium]
MAIPISIQEAISKSYLLTQEQIDFYQKNRFIKLKQVFNAETIGYFNTVISAKVAEMNQVKTKVDERDTYGKAFLQLFNLWREDEHIQQFVFSKRLAKIAADLMQVDGVRLYHDQALFKEGGGGITPWHADQYYWPLETDKTVTAWIPLQETLLEMGPLEFSAGSHQIVEGRELEIGDESETLIQQRLRVTDFKHVIEAFDLGEVSFHSGWVFHRAGANTTDKMRKVMTIIYMDSKMRLKQPENKNQINDWNTWCPGAVVGEVIQSPINPVLY